MASKLLNSLDLFSGIGGITLALEGRGLHAPWHTPIVFIAAKMTSTQVRFEKTTPRHTASVR
jgi:site-specific DNA-cytosine methylase